jgi:DNA-binding response OmpR family regulator
VNVSLTWPEYLAGCCRLDGRLTRLTFQQADLLLVLLLQHPERPLPVREMVDRLWPNPEREPGDPENVIVAVIGALRERGVMIEARRGFGYRIPAETRGRERGAALAA